MALHSKSNYPEQKNIHQTASNSAFQIANKQTCKHPAYLFWKLQSHLIKLTQKLHKTKKQP